MGKSDNNPRRYRLTVTRAEYVPSPGLEGPEIVLEVEGALSGRAKRDLREAVDAGRVRVKEKRIA